MNLHTQSIGEIIQIVEERVNAQRQDVILSALYGSTSRNEHGVHSDIDVLLITDGEFLTKQNISTSGPKLQIIAGSIAVISKKIQKARRERNPFFLNILRDAICISGSEPLLGSLKNLANVIYRAGPEAFEPEKVRSKLSQIADSVEKSMFAEDDVVRCISRVRAYNILQDVIADKHGKWLSIGLYRAKEFSLEFPDYARRLAPALLHPGNNGAPLAAVIADIIATEFPDHATDESPIKMWR